MIEDKQLIRQYAVDRSEPAFAELVRRHLKMVYAAALRQVNGDTHLAEDVAQSVFADFARKAGKLQDHVSIAGWLYNSTRFTAANAVRGEARRRSREQEVVAMNEMNSDTNPGWNELRPMIDEALSELGDTDREAIVLRYFESREFSLVGAALGVSENAARMRVDRALEKLRGVLQKRGLTATNAVLAGVLAESSATALPAQLAAGITSAALRHAAAAAVSSAPSIVRLIAMKKISLAVAGACALSLAAVLVARNAASADPQKDAAALSRPKQPAALQLGDLAPSVARTGDPDIFKKLVQRHDEQVQARRGQTADDDRTAWDKEWAGFDDSLKDEPGVKKFGGKIQITIAPGEALVTGGWQIAPGKTMMVLVRPKFGNAESEAAGVPSNQILTSFRVITVSQPDTGARDLLGTLSGDQADTMFNYLTNKAGSDVVYSPKIMQKVGQEASISVGSEELISGKQQHLGLKINFFPNRSTDGSSLDVGMLVQYTVPMAGGDSPANSQ